jgi:hypothetical protein
MKAVQFACLRISTRNILSFIFCVFTYCSLPVTAYTQSADVVPRINIPTSPEAAMLGRFGDIPVGYYTGTADVSVPIYTIKEGSVEIPITLRYHGSGIKVDDQATWVGLGWDLSPEGSITQEIRGKEDDDDVNLGTACEANVMNLFQQRYNFIGGKTYMFLPQWGRSTAPNSCLFQIISDPDPGPPWYNTYEESYCIVDRLRNGYGQPDIYHYSFNGQSGKFYIHPATKEIVVTEKKDQVYFKIVNGDLTATTLDGTVYTFGVMETVEGGVRYDYTGKTFKLTSIQLLNGSTITFTYTDHYYEERNYYGTAEVNNFMPRYPVEEEYSYNHHYKKTLTRITSRDAIIDFNLSDREDINLYADNNMKKLSSIDITSRLTNKKIKTFKFIHSYFPYTTDAVQTDATINANPGAFGKRLKLDSLKEIGYNDAGVQVATKPTWNFEYDMRYTMPMKVSFAKDFWGYYNGSNNGTLLPNLDYFDYFNEPDYKTINQPMSYPYTGGNRYTDTALAGAYMLKKIKYPTGGFTEFEYEANTFTNQYIPIKSTPFFKIHYADDNSVSTTNGVKLFKILSSSNVHFENRIMNGRGNPNGVTPLTYNQMAGCYISFSKIKTVNGSPVTTLIKRWDLSSVYTVDFDANGGKTWIEDLRVEFDADPTVQYQVKTEFPDNLNNPLFNSIAGVSSQVSFYDKGAIDKSISTQCGIRVKTIKSYTEPGKLASHKELKYYDGKLLNRFRPLAVYNANHLDNSGVTNGNGYEYIGFYKRITINTNDFGTNGGNLIGYGKVEETELVNGAATSGKKVYYYLNTENQTQQGCPYIPNLSNGLLAKEEVYDNLNVKLQEKEYTHTVLPSPNRYIAMSAVLLSTGTKVPCGNYTYPTPYTTAYYTNNGGFYNTSEYGYNVYTIDAQYNKLQSVVTREFSGTGTLTQTETYTFNAEGSKSTATTINSKGESLITKYYYANDNMINATIDAAMTQVHNTGTPVITEQYKGTTLLSKQRTVYGNFPSITSPVPQFIYDQKGSNPEELRVTINSYDDRGNITQYTEQNNIPVSFVWNADKTLPIAKVENAAYTTLQSLPGGLSADFRAQLPNARVTTYTYKPLIGVSTITDANNRPNYYEYDAFGRLLFIKDHKGNIVKTFDYHYKQ